MENVHLVDKHFLIELRNAQSCEFGVAAGVETFEEFAAVVAVGGAGTKDVAVAVFDEAEDADYAGTAFVG